MAWYFGQHYPTHPRYYGLMRQTKTLSTSLWLSLWAVGLCRLLQVPAGPEALPGVISAHLSPDAWTPPPAVPLVHTARFFPEDIGLRQRWEPARQHAQYPYSDFRTGMHIGAAVIRSCSEPPGLLATQVAPTAMGLVDPLGSRGFSVRAS